MGWNLNSNSFDESPGHDTGCLITSMIKHDSFILSADNLGTVQVRDLNSQFNKVMADQSVIQPANGIFNKQNAMINSMVVLILPPNMQPYIFTSSTQGYINCISNLHGVYSFGAHNDKSINFQPQPHDFDIDLLVKMPTGDKFYSFSKNGLLRLWVLSKVPALPSAPLPNAAQQQFSQGQSQFQQAPVQ